MASTVNIARNPYSMISCETCDWIFINIQHRKLYNGLNQCKASKFWNVPSWYLTYKKYMQDWSLLMKALDSRADLRIADIGAYDSLKPNKTRNLIIRIALIYRRLIPLFLGYTILFSAQSSPWGRFCWIWSCDIFWQFCKTRTELRFYADAMGKQYTGNGAVT